MKKKQLKTEYLFLEALQNCHPDELKILKKRMEGIKIDFHTPGEKVSTNQNFKEFEKILNDFMKERESKKTVNSQNLPLKTEETTTSIKRRLNADGDDDKENLLLNLESKRAKTIDKGSSDIPQGCLPVRSQSFLHPLPNTKLDTAYVEPEPTVGMCIIS